MCVSSQKDLFHKKIFFWMVWMKRFVRRLNSIQWLVEFIIIIYNIYLLLHYHHSYRILIMRVVTEKKDLFHKKIFFCMVWMKRFVRRLNSIRWLVESIIIIYNISPFLLFLYIWCVCVCVSQKKKICFTKRFFFVWCGWNDSFVGWIVYDDWWSSSLLSITSPFSFLIIFI
jgi:hypothetical protein